MRIIHDGDLLTSTAEALVNPVNTVGVMGKGLALAFRRAHPDSYAAYRTACGNGELRVGKVFPTRRDGGWIVHFPTKRHWRDPSRMEWIESGLSDLVRFLRENDVRSVAVPALGCGLGGLAWEEVEPVVRDALGTLEDVSVELYAPRGAKAGLRDWGDPV